MLRPLRLHPDNFTPATRTPWGGTKILSRYKRLLQRPPEIVGESWEISVEPSFPSRIVEGADRSDASSPDRSVGQAEPACRATLEAAIAADPEGWLGSEVARASGGQLSLLVKLLDAADNLSVQVHPAAGDPRLAPHESGKPEAWVILEREPGAGLYLGFRDGVQRADVEDSLRTGGALNELMNFVPVEPWEAYVIDAGTAHAIGAGVTLFEPQHITPGRVGVTYRYWDWNRRYDASGRPSPDGSPRALHVEESLRVTTWDGPRGEAFVAGCRRALRAADAALPGVATAPSTRVSAHPDGPRTTALVDWRYFRVASVCGVGATVLVGPPTLTSLTCLAGELRLATEAGELDLRCGESAVVPVAAGAVRLEMRGGDLGPAQEPTVLVCWPGVGDAS